MPSYEKSLKEKQAELDSITIESESVIAEYYNIRLQIEKLRALMRETLNLPVHSLPFLQPGRLVKIVDGAQQWGWGVLVNFQKKKVVDKTIASDSNDYILDVLLNCQPDSKPPVPASADGKGVIQVVPVILSLVDGISTIRVYIPKDLRSVENRNSVGKTIREVLRRYPNGVPVLDPFEDMHIEDPAFKKLVLRIESLEDRLVNHTEFSREDLLECLYLLFLHFQILFSNFFFFIFLFPKYSLQRIRKEIENTRRNERN